MKLSRISLSEGIHHLEDLPVDEFVRVISNLGSMTAQEKLDGAQLWVGRDDQGKLYTSREGKRDGAERRFASTEWPQVADFNQFRAAHAAIEAVNEQVCRVLRPGDTVEAEVLFGRQPNSVIYGANGSSYIAFLRGVEGTPDSIAEQLSQTLSNQQVQAKADLVDTADGAELSTTHTDTPFRFVTPHRMDVTKLKQESGVEDMLAELQKMLSSASEIDGMTVQQLISTSLTSIPKPQREQVKAAREKAIAAVQLEFKLPIKRALLAKVGRRSGLAADDITDDEDVGIEGIVLRDPSTGEQIKVVDKDIFTTINRFNQSARGEVQSALNTTDPDASLESRGGLVGELRIRIAEALGNRELAKPSNLRKVLVPLKGKTSAETAKNFADSIKVLEDFQGTKKKLLALISTSFKALAEKLDSFKENKDNYRLKLKNGKEIGLSADTVKRTLLTFAEARRNMLQLFERVKGTGTAIELISVLYGGVINGAQETIQEGLLLERTGEISLDAYERRDTFQLMNSYIATVLMSMVIFHTLDTPGMRLLRDRKNHLLRKHSPDMSPLNHWGYVIWRVSKPDVKKHVTKAVVSEFARVTKKIPTPWWKYLHMDLSFNNEVVVDWGDHHRTLRRLLDLAGMRSDRLNTLIDECVGFDKLDLKQQRRTIKRLNGLAHQFVTRSSLFVRTRAIEKRLKDATEPMLAEGLLKQISAIAEDEGAAPAEGAAGTQVATATGAIATVPMKLGLSTRKTEMRRRGTSERFKSLLMPFKKPQRQETQ